MDYTPGCDVSHLRPVVDWDAMIASGIQWIAAKASQGTGFRDPMLAAHRDGRRARAPLVGAVFYHFVDVTEGNSPEDEAANFIAAVGPLQGDELLAQDVEQGPSGKGAPPIDWQIRFNAALPVRHRADGRLIPNGVYSATHVWNEIGNPAWPDATAGNVFLWLKRYAPDYGPCPSPWSYPTLWQNSATGIVPGVKGPQVDTDYFVGPPAACHKFFKGA